MLPELAFYVTVAAYAVASALFFVYLANPKVAVLGTKAAPFALSLAAVSHTAYVCLASLVANVCPVNQSISLHRWPR